MTKKQIGKSVKGLINGVVFLVLLLLVTVILYLTLKPEKEKTIKIGCLLTLSGSGASMGMDIADGLSFASNEINSWGGINGKKIEFIIEDTQSNPDVAKEMFEKIESEHQPVFYISNMSSIALELAPLAEEYQTPLVGLITSTSRLTPQNSWVFRYWSSARTEADAMLGILKKIEVKNIGILNINDEYGLSVSEIILKSLKKDGNTITHKGFSRDERNFRNRINEMIDMEAIMVIGFPPHIESAAKQLKEIGYKGKIIFSIAASRPDVRRITETEGAYVPASFFYKQDFIFTQKAGKKFTEKYGREFNHSAANGYDFMKIFSFVMSGKDISRSSVKNNLGKGFIYSGVFGEVRTARGERDISFDLHPARIVNGKIEFMK